MSEHCGCHTPLNAVDKIRRKGVSEETLPQAFEIKCSCGTTFTMTTHEAKCPSCNMVYGVTSCSVDNIDNVVSVGINY